MDQLKKLFIRNENAYMLLKGNNHDSEIFLFIHGYGSSPLDLLPLAKQINSTGYSCALILLSGHGGSGEDLIGQSYSKWKNDLKKAILHFGKTYNSIYLIGFSLGATLCLDVSDCKKVKGVIGLSTFLGLKNVFAKVGLCLSSVLKIKMIPRLLQATSKKTKSEVYGSKSLPTNETISLIKQAGKLLIKPKAIKCKSLLIHSVNDNVSDYDKVRELTQIHDNVKLITLRGLNHLIQFDIRQHALANVILEFFFSSEEKHKDKIEIQKELFSQISEEFNHWSGLLFRLIVGFSTVFGALVYFSLPDVLQNKPSAPYYLTSYSIINSLFIILAAIYFFYTNRVNVYMKHQLEFFSDVVPWVKFRTNPYLSGKESSFFTTRAAIPIIGTPLVISIGSLTYLMFQYRSLYLEQPLDHILLVCALVFALVVFVLSVLSLIQLQRYTSRELYHIIPERFETYPLRRKIYQLYFNIIPGCVRQMGQ